DARAQLQPPVRANPGRRHRRDVAGGNRAPAQPVSRYGLSGVRISRARQAQRGRTLPVPTGCTFDGMATFRRPPWAAKQGVGLVYLSGGGGNGILPGGSTFSAGLVSGTAFLVSTLAVGLGTGAVVGPALAGAVKG